MVVEKEDIGSVSMLGVDGELDWLMTSKGLEIKPPKEKPCRYVYTFKILLEN